MKKLFIILLLVIVCGLGFWFFSEDFYPAESDALKNGEERVDARLREISGEKEGERKSDASVRESERKEEEREMTEKSEALESQTLSEKNPMSSLVLGVPFTTQAPFGEWSNPHFQNGCEEATLVMATHFLSGKPLSKDIAKKEIVALARFQEKSLGQSVDTSALDTLKLFQDYYESKAGRVQKDITLLDIQENLALGSLIIVPADGRKLKNPHFKAPGPKTHMLVIIGYDAKKKEFITHDPGTQYGEEYRYAEDVLYDALRDYPTGNHLPIPAAQAPSKVMIVISKL